jgi:hypothetical protein
MEDDINENIQSLSQPKNDHSVPKISTSIFLLSLMSMLMQLRTLQEMRQILQGLVPIYPTLTS